MLSPTLSPRTVLPGECVGGRVDVQAECPGPGVAVGILVGARDAVCPSSEITSPMRDISDSCLQCHRGKTEAWAKERVRYIQDSVFSLQRIAGRAVGGCPWRDRGGRRRGRRGPLPRQGARAAAAGAMVLGLRGLGQLDRLPRSASGPAEPRALHRPREARCRRRALATEWKWRRAPRMSRMLPDERRRGLRSGRGRPRRWCP